MPDLVVMDGPQKGRRFPITDETTHIGRVAGNHVVLESLSVSSNHAAIVRSTEGYRLRDLDSTNGTRVNSHRITDTLLFRDDEIFFGDLPVIFCGGDAPQRKDAEPTPVAPAPVSPPLQPVEPRPSVVIATSSGGKTAKISMPRDFRKRRDARLLWMGVILILLIGIVYGIWKYYQTLFAN